MRETLIEIENYTVIHFSSNAGKAKVETILKKIEAIAVFPEIGVSADEKFGVQVDKKYFTRCVPADRDYLILYFVDELQKLIVITHLLPTKTDYLRLFGK